MNGQVLEETKEERDIGVIVSANMKSTAQCSQAAQTAQRVLGQLARAFHYRDRHIFLRLFKHSCDHISNFLPKPGPHGLKETEIAWRKYSRGQSKLYQDSKATSTRSG